MTADHAPAWLFSFVDLAFLLLIAMTQLGGRGETLTLGELVVPRIRGEATSSLPTGASDRWQLRIHPPASPGDATAPHDVSRAGPFELLQPAGNPTVGVRVATSDALRDRLRALRAADGRRPILAPHADARSEDLLDAVALVEEVWPGRRRAAVSPGSLRP